MMTKRTFIPAGLFLIALGPLFMALQTFLLLSETIPKETYVYFDLFRYVAIPLLFALLLWKRLKHIGKSRRFTACCSIGFLAAFFATLLLLPLLVLNLDINTAETLTNEIAAWSKSGVKGDFNFSVNGKIKVAFYNAIISAVASWSLLAALYLGASNTQPPTRDYLERLLSKRKTAKGHSAVSHRKQMIS